jgi:hypothetical protein
MQISIRLALNNNNNNNNNNGMEWELTCKMLRCMPSKGNSILFIHVVPRFETCLGSELSCHSPEPSCLSYLSPELSCLGPELRQVSNWVRYKTALIKYVLEWDNFYFCESTIDMTYRPFDKKHFIQYMQINCRDTAYSQYIDALGNKNVAGSNN